MNETVSNICNSQIQCDDTLKRLEDKDYNCRLDDQICNTESNLVKDSNFLQYQVRQLHQKKKAASESMWSTIVYRKSLINIS